MYLNDLVIYSCDYKVEKFNL